jgi:hypothetical protein
MRGWCNGMLFEGQGFIDMYAEVFDDSTALYGLIVYCEGLVEGEFLCLALAVVGQAVKEF